MNKSHPTIPELGPLFWARVTRAETGCWLWRGSRLVDGYGRIGFRGKTYKAHRLSLEIAIGRPLEPHEMACHHCDNPPCVRPDHLFAGTCKDNLADAARKGRMASGPRNGKYSHPNATPRGERHGRAKLTEADVREIRALRATGLSQQAIADRFGTPQTNISLIVRGIGWRHIV